VIYRGKAAVSRVIYRDLAGAIYRGQLRLSTTLSTSTELLGQVFGARVVVALEHAQVFVASDRRQLQNVCQLLAKRDAASWRVSWK
jgi:hypothetical protein